MAEQAQEISTEGKVISEEAIVEIINQCKTEIQNNSSNKVDKEEGKGLSTNDFTTTEKNKLNGIENDADVNVIESISVNGIPLSITNKNVNILLGENNYSIMTDTEIDALWESATGELGGM